MFLKKLFSRVGVAVAAYRGADIQEPGASVIGASIRFKGELQGEEDVVVIGHVEGDVSLGDHEFTLRPEGKADATVNAGSIMIEGHVDGDLWGTSHVVVNESARVKGNITAPRVILEDGCKFKGTIDMNLDEGTLHTLAPKQKSSETKPAEKPH